MNKTIPKRKFLQLDIQVGNTPIKSTFKMHTLLVSNLTENFTQLITI